MISAMRGKRGNAKILFRVIIVLISSHLAPTAPNRRATRVQLWSTRL